MATKITPHYCPVHRARYIGDQRQIWLANPDNRAFCDTRWVLWFGAYADTYVMVWEDSLEDALETAADFLANHGFSGHFVDMTDAYQDAARDLGLDWPSDDEHVVCKVVDAAEADLTYTESGFIPSWEWGYLAENPTRDDLLNFIGDQS